MPSRIPGSTSSAAASATRRFASLIVSPAGVDPASAFALSNRASVTGAGLCSPVCDLLWSVRLDNETPADGPAAPKRVVIHIGSTKTGSSALQTALYKRREELAASGVHSTRLTSQGVFSRVSSEAAARST